MSTQLTLQGDDLNDRYANDPHWWPRLLDNVRSGVPPHQIAASYLIKYALFLGWVAGDPDRKKEFYEALEHREQDRQELVRQGVYDIATAVIDPALIRPSDKLKAADTYMGGGAAGKGGALAIGVPGGTGSVNIVVEFVPGGRVIEHEGPAI